jgi:predicted nucleic acid-binding protein
VIGYYDTSALLKLYWKEEGAEQVQLFWRSKSRAVSSAVAYAEGVSAFYRKKKISEPPESDFENNLEQFRRDWSTMVQIAVTSELNPELERLSETYLLRGFDALHLASAITVAKQLPDLSALTFLCFDQQLCKAACAESLTVIPPLISRCP